MSAIPLEDDRSAVLKEALAEKPAKERFSAETLRRDLAINDADLDTSMTEQAGLYGYYSALYAKAQYEADMAKNRVEIAKARAYKDVRSRLISKGAKFSEALLEAEVILHPDYQDASEMAAKYRMQAEMLRQGLEALKQRRDMLVQKGKSRLEELRGELFLKAPGSLEDKKALARSKLGRATQPDGE